MAATILKQVTLIFHFELLIVTQGKWKFNSPVLVIPFVFVLDNKLVLDNIPILYINF